ncbi:Hsp33 family molecular chaperone [Agaricicola taiwanensis]|nr:Hsp33 family molecular chaperone [Agaricicola taiwanensis]
MSDLGPESLIDGPDDRILPFQVEGLDVRGRVVRLGPSVDAMIARHGYPPIVSKVLGEAVALTALLGSSLKFEGRFQLQTKSDGLIDMIVVDFEAPDRVRGYARFNEEGVAALKDARLPTGGLLGRGHLALTIDPGGDMARYQGVVPLSGESLEDAAHQYFQQSEQIPTRVRLAVAEAWTGGSIPSWRAGGLLVQFLPEAGARVRVKDLDPGDAPEGAAVPAEPEEDDAWTEAQALVETIEDHELIDPMVTSERLLFRLFHERGVRVFDGSGVQEKCRCSREKVETMLRQFPEEDRRDMVADDGSIVVTCEFCSTRYRFDPDDLKPRGGEDQ